MNQTTKSLDVERLTLIALEAAVHTNLDTATGLRVRTSFNALRGHEGSDDMELSDTQAGAVVAVSLAPDRVADALSVNLLALRSVLFDVPGQPLPAAISAPSALALEGAAAWLQPTLGEWIGLFLNQRAGDASFLREVRLDLMEADGVAAAAANFAFDGVTAQARFGPELPGRVCTVRYVTGENLVGIGRTARSLERPSEPGSRVHAIQQVIAQAQAAFATQH